MADDPFIRLIGLDAVRAALGQAGDKVRKAARLAINDTARKMRTRGSREIRGQVNLTAAYVNQNLRITRKARDNSLTAVIGAADRPVLLTRYGAKQLTRKAENPESSRGDPLRGIPSGRKAAGISVKVKRGGARKKMRGAFFIPLKGSGAIGVAVRTGPGRGDYEVKHGPSVDQVWRSVRVDISQEAQAFLSSEFRRQMGRVL